MTHEVPLVPLDAPTKNGRLYSRALFEKMLFRELEHPLPVVTSGAESYDFNHQTQVGIVRQLFVRQRRGQDWLYAVLQFGNTNIGELASRVAAQSPHCFSPFGSGTIQDHVVQPDYILFGVHMDTDPCPRHSGLFFAGKRKVKALYAPGR